MTKRETWQAWILQESDSAAEVFGYDGSLVGPIQISTVVAPQTNVQIANQIAAGVGLRPTFSLGLAGANSFSGFTGQRAG